MSEEEGDFDTYPEGYELEGRGSKDHVEENETTVLFAKLGDELQMLVQRYSVPPADLEQLFQVRGKFWGGSVGGGKRSRASPLPAYASGQMTILFFFFLGGAAHV